MKLDVLVKNGIDVKMEKKRHARAGDIIIPSYCRRYEPMFVIRSYFEPRCIEKYGIDSEEILHHGTNYVDCIRLEDGVYRRLQYYEYRILTNSVRLRRKFVEKWADAAEVMEALGGQKGEA